MPHQCTDCDSTYADGSESVLTGCASCGGTTFQYVPPSVAAPPTEEETTSNEPLGGGVINVGGEDDEPEDASQHSARTDIVDADELPARTPDASASEDGGDADALGEYEVDLDALRQELNRQFEGIHIVAPGHYELNLMELYRREECIITLHEDGRYAIGVPGDEDFSLNPNDAE